MNGNSSQEVWRLGTAKIAGDQLVVVETAGRLVPLSRVLGPSAPEPLTLLDLVEDWDSWRERIVAGLGEVGDGDALDRAGLEWMPPIQPRKLIICGANYKEHVEEMGTDPAAILDPFCQQKPASTSPLGDGQPLVLPKRAEWVDWEGELGAVIGRGGRNLRGEEALGAIAGYMPVNDISARDWVEKQVPGVGMDWTLHKGFDGFTPMGPLVTPAEFVSDPQNLQIRLTVNGVVKQDASTSDMIFSVERLVEHLSSVMTLEPGDVLLTGSPSGTGFSRSPRERLEAGDEVVVEVEGLGSLSNPVVAENA